MLFSVVIPIWNKRPHIERAVNSVLNQSYQNFEIIAVDDCSNDGSIDELKIFSDQRIRIISNHGLTPVGPGGARNLGISAACGEWISFLDADDAWEKNYLEEMLKLIKLFPGLEILSCAYMIFENENKNILAPYGMKYIKKGYHYLSLKDYLKAYLKNLPPVWTSTTTVRKTMFDKTGFFAEGVINCEDIDMWLRIMSETNLAWSPYIGATYYQNSVNKISKFENKNILDNRPNIEKLIKINSSTQLLILLKKYKNCIIISQSVIKIIDGIGVKFKDYSGFEPFLNPLLTIELFMLIFLPERIILILLSIRRKGITIKENIQSMILSVFQRDS